MDNSNKRQPPPLPDERQGVLKFGSEIEIVCNLDAIMQSRGISQMALSQETGLSSLDELFTIRYKKGVTN